MAATTVNFSRAPIARPASVDADFGGTLAAKQITVSGQERFANDGYIVLGAEPSGSQVASQEEWPTVTLRGDVISSVQSNRWIIGERTLAPSANLTAAT